MNSKQMIKKEQKKRELLKKKTGVDITQWNIRYKDYAERMMKCKDDSEQLINLCAEAMTFISKQRKNKDILYENKIDLINYEDLYIMALEQQMNRVIPYHDFSWWIFEDVRKIIWIDEKEYNVSSAMKMIRLCRKVQR